MLLTYWYVLLDQDHNLYQITQEREQRPFSEGKISTFMSQMLQVLAHMHKNSYFHRQLKPSMYILSCWFSMASLLLNNCFSLFLFWREFAGDQQYPQDCWLWTGLRSCIYASSKMSHQFQVWSWILTPKTIKTLLLYADRRVPAESFEWRKQEDSFGNTKSVKVGSRNDM